VTIKILNALIAVVGGVLGAIALYWLLNKLAELLPGRWEDRVKPFLFLLPALGAITLYLIYPTIQTVVYSFANAGSTEFVGLSNYSSLLTSKNFQNTLFNTLLWILVVPAGTIVLGLLIATLADRLRPRSEKLSKTLIFMPMAIGAVSAGAIWRFVYATNPPTQKQIGLLNGLWVGLGGEPVNWLQLSTLRFNSFLLMVMLLWLQAGFAMVLLSAAIKGVPTETLEAARLDGASEAAIFFRIIVPQIRTTIITVFITVVIYILASQIPALASVPGTTFGYACTFAFLLQTPDRLALPKLLSASFDNSLVVVPVSMVAGALFGFASAKLAAALTKPTLAVA